MSKYISNKIISHGTFITRDGKSTGEYVIIRAEDYPNEPGMRRTTYFRGDLQGVQAYAAQGRFECSGTPDYETAYIGVEVEKFREFRPMLCITEDELLKQYEAMQQDGKNGLGPIKDLNLRRDPEMLALARKLWSERLSTMSKTTT